MLPSRAVPALWLRLEGLAAFTVAILLYQRSGGGWVLFALLLLAPDLSMLGYLRGPRAGAAAYNLFHIYLGPLLLATAGVILESTPTLWVSLVWLAHIGMDRALGYGLKLPTGFQDTDLGPIGKVRST